MAVLVTSALELGSDDERELNPETKKEKERARTGVFEEEQTERWEGGG